jgi:hypothetical protein
MVKGDKLQGGDKWVAMSRYEVMRDQGCKCKHSGEEFEAAQLTEDANAKLRRFSRGDGFPLADDDEWDTIGIQPEGRQRLKSETVFKLSDQRTIQGNRSI